MRVKYVKGTMGEEPHFLDFIRQYQLQHSLLWSDYVNLGFIKYDLNSYGQGENEYSQSLVLQSPSL